MTHNELYNKLIESIKKYHPSNDYSMVEKAYLLAREAHGDQLRKSGEPYIIHPLSVAILLAGLELDLESIVAGILHDVIEDTSYSYEDIAQMFSPEIADLVDGVTKLDKIQYISKEEIQAENYRKMFLAMAKDIRVILIKIADRLHNMRTLKFMTPEKQKEIAQETIDIYAPLAHRLGISTIRYELEDLCFRYLNPDAYYELADKIVRKQSERQEYVSLICKELREKMLQYNIECEVQGRPKHFFSIYKKMVNQNKTLDQIYDLFAVRVIVDSIRDCYAVLGIVHEMYKPVPGRFKDYIAMPKSNMYRSLHNALIGPQGEPFEIQIRTQEMHRTSEYGIAAHWKYKQKQNGEVTPEHEEEKLSWLRQILEWQRDCIDNKEFLQTIKVDLNVFQQHVYCFSPKGEVFSLLSGSTPIDFAYAVHSAVGNKTIGARVNGKMVTIDYELKNGDRVEIVTSQNSKGPSQDWLKVAKTSQAKSKINQWFKKQNKDENIQKGKELLEKEAKKKNFVLSELLANKRDRVVLERYAFQEMDTLYAAIGHGAIKENQVLNRLIEEYEKEVPKVIDPKELIEKQIRQAEKTPKKNPAKGAIIVKGIGDVGEVRLSKCCSPVPGDEIVGFITRGRGLSIHRTDCVNILNLDELERHRLTEVWWNMPQKGVPGTSYRAELIIYGNARPTLLTDISILISDEKIPMRSMNARMTKDAVSIFNLSIDITGKEQLESLRNKLLRIKDITDVERVTT